MSPEELRLRFSRAMSAELAQNRELMNKIDTMLWILFPQGIEPSDYGDVVLAVRTLDQLCRSINDSDELGDESSDEVATAAPAMDLDHVHVDDEDDDFAASCDGVVQAFVEDRTEPVTPRAIEQARIRREKPWSRLGSFDLSEYADRY